MRAWFDAWADAWGDSWGTDDVEPPVASARRYVTMVEY